MPRKVTLYSVEKFRGLNLNHPKSMLSPEDLARLENFILRRGGALRLRPGMARMNMETETVLLEAASFEDDFESYSLSDDLDTVSADWTDVGEHPITVKSHPSSGQAVEGDFDAAGDNRGYYIHDSWAGGNDQWAEIEFTENLNTSQAIGVMVRMSSTPTGYLLQISGAAFPANGTHGFSVYRVDAMNSLNAVAAIGDPGFSAGDRIRLAVYGSGQLRAYVNDVEVWRGSDSTYSTGKPGIYTFDTSSGSGRIDDFKAGVARADHLWQIQSGNESTRMFPFERSDGTQILVIAHGDQLRAVRIGTPEWTE